MVFTITTFFMGFFCCALLIMIYRKLDQLDQLEKINKHVEHIDNRLPIIESVIGELFSINKYGFEELKKRIYELNFIDGKETEISKDAKIIAVGYSGLPPKKKKKIPLRKFSEKNSEKNINKITANVYPQFPSYSEAIRYIITNIPDKRSLSSEKIYEKIIEFNKKGHFGKKYENIEYHNIRRRIYQLEKTNPKIKRKSAGKWYFDHLAK